MAPPSPPYHAERFARRTAPVTLYGARICGTAWLLFMCWVLWTQPDNLGPARMIGGLALASVTAACTVLWWLSTMKIKECLDRISEPIRIATTNGGQEGGRIHHIDTSRR